MDNSDEINFIAHGVFPTPVLFFRYEEGLTPQEKKQLMSYDLRENLGNKSSQDFHVLESKKLKKLRSFIDKCVNTYLKKIVCPERQDVELYITQSWMNYTKAEQWHHRHAHPNSYISGVFYVQSNTDNNDEGKQDTITFFNESAYKQISIPAKDYNPFNSGSWYYPIKEGDLVLFPSSLTHEVSAVTGELTRASLAFNTFVKGYIGNDETFTGLHL